VVSAYASVDVAADPYPNNSTGIKTGGLIHLESPIKAVQDEISINHSSRISIKEFLQEAVDERLHLPPAPEQPQNVDRMKKKIVDQI